VIRVTENFRKIQDLLAEAAVQAGRDPQTVKLLAASKSRAAETVLLAAQCGQRDFGENFVQEGIDKITATAGNDLVWHFIGQLQSNKTRPVAEHFDWVHTIDRIKIAERLDKQRPHFAPSLNVCIQVNVDNEAGKGGVTAGDLLPLARAVSELPNLSLRGLMCIPAIRSTPTAQREPFAMLRRLLGELRETGISGDTLSMGMTDDFQAAIFEGATIVRIGTALFGPRAQEP
jgi:pyridoxal phosphate enzyme (YggS family)